MADVLLINGSPHKNGCTATALEIVAHEIEDQGLSTETVWLGNNTYAGCTSCHYCAHHDRCVRDDIVNELLPQFEEAKGLVVGSAVHYASATGTITSVLDRLFYAKSFDTRFKVGACVVSCRRGGASATFDQLNKYFTISQMPIVSSRYWNSVHGYTREDVLKDIEGCQTMMMLGRNMAFLIKSIDLGREHVGLPELEEPRWTHFMDGK
ncbi:MAG: flavodoxin family protein [Atopobiaceae bacterium]